jgi:hypothetical protein
MRARQLLDGSGSGFTAATMTAMNQAFNSAWAMIADQYGADAHAINTARLKLAECILAVTRDGMMDAAQIERLALAMFRISK